MDENDIRMIRVNAREKCNAYRLKRRRLAADLKRDRLQEVVTELKVPSREEFAELCEEFRKNNRSLEVLQRIRLSVGSKEEYGSVFLSALKPGDGGGIYPLIGCLTGNNASLQREAACTVINLALGSEKECLQICKQAGVYLVLHLSNSNPDLQDPCAWGIGNLCGGNPSVCELMQSQGVEEGLVNILNTHTPHVLQSVTYAITQYLITQPHRIRPMFNTSIKVSRLVQGLSSTGAVAEVGWCLCVLSMDEGMCPLLVDHRIIEHSFNALERLINEENLNVAAVTPISRVLMNCAAYVPGVAIEICYRGEQFVKVTRALLYSGTQHLQKETIHLVANVMNSAASESITGQCVIEDLNLKPRLEAGLKRALASHFTLYSPSKPIITFT